MWRHIAVIIKIFQEILSKKSYSISNVWERCALPLNWQNINTRWRYIIFDFFILCEMPTLITNKLKTIGLFTIDIRNKWFYSRIFQWMVKIVYTDKTFLLQKFSEIRRVLKNIIDDYSREFTKYIYTFKGNICIVFI